MPLISVPIVRLDPITPRSRLLTLDLREATLTFEPGQAVVVGAREQRERRPYSIACSPERVRDTRRLELLIAMEPDGGLPTNLGAAVPGTVMDVEGPFGTFTLPGALPGDRIVFVAGGTGIAPLRSMIDHLLRSRARPRLSLLYSARRPDEFAFVEELQAHAEAGTLELQCTVTREDSAAWTGRRGRIGRDHFEAMLHDPGATLCVVCGPDSLVRESVSSLRSLGVPDAYIRTESWLATG